MARKRESFGDVVGADEIIRKIRDLPERIGNNAGRRALRKGANVIRNAARQNAKSIDDPRTSESIEKNIVTSGGGRRRERSAGGPMMRVGVRGGARNMEKYGEFKGAGKGNPGGDTWYWRLLEFGFRHVRSGRMIAPRSFMRRAMNDKAQEALSVTSRDMQSQLDREIAKLGEG